MCLIDLTGQKFGKLTVIERAENAKSGRVRWLCKCDCGGVTISQSNDLKSGRAKSCGCLRHTPPPNKTHGKSKTRIYRIRRAIIARCYNSNHEQYKDYGGRGITVCVEWLNSFTAFYEWAVASGYTDDLTIDRKDNNGNYEPNNCCWVTRKEQANNRRNNILVTYNGKTQSVTQLAEELGIDSAILRARIYIGWDIEKAINTPIRKRAAN